MATRKHFDISWLGVIQILWMYVGHNIIEVEKANFEKPIKNLKLQLNVWKSRNLQILLVKTLGTSQFLFLTEVIQERNYFYFISIYLEWQHRES